MYSPSFVTIQNKLSRKYYGCQIVIDHTQLTTKLFIFRDLNKFE